MPEGGPAFSSVRKARAALKEKALETYMLMLQIIKQAAAAGDYETAAKYTAWLIDHTPDEDGERIVAESIDKKESGGGQSGPSGPTIQIGLQIGGVAPKQLPSPKIIDVEPESGD